MRWFSPAKMSARATYLAASINLNSVLKAALESACVELGLPKSGNKPDLYARLKQHFDGSDDDGSQSSSTQPSSHDDASATVTELSSPHDIMVQAERNIDRVLARVLQSACKRLGLPSSGTKALMLKLLQQHFQEAVDASSAAADYRDDASAPAHAASSHLAEPSSQAGLKRLVDSALRGDCQLLIMFNATWCIHCKKAKPVFLQLAKSWQSVADDSDGAGLTFAVVSADAEVELPAYGLKPTAFPAFYEVSKKRKVREVDLAYVQDLVQSAVEDATATTSTGTGTGAGAGARATSFAMMAGTDRIRPSMPELMAFNRCPEGLRESVTSSINHAFDFRGSVDLYTGLAEDVVRTMRPQVDHVVEIQLANVAWCTALKQVPVGARTRGAKVKLEEIINSVVNLNVTPAAINQSKKGPFQAFVNRLVDGGDRPAWKDDETCIGDLARKGSKGVRALVEDGIWDNIERAVLTTQDQLIEEISTSTPSWASMAISL